MLKIKLFLCVVILLSVSCNLENDNDIEVIIESCYIDYYDYSLMTDTGIVRMTHTPSNTVGIVLNFNNYSEETISINFPRELSKEESIIKIKTSNCKGNITPYKSKLLETIYLSSDSSISYGFDIGVAFEKSINDIEKSYDCITKKEFELFFNDLVDSTINLKYKFSEEYKLEYYFNDSLINRKRNSESWFNGQYHYPPISGEFKYLLEQIKVEPKHFNSN